MVVCEPVHSRYRKPALEVAEGRIRDLVLIDNHAWKCMLSNEGSSEDPCIQLQIPGVIVIEQFD